MSLKANDDLDEKVLVFVREHPASPFRMIWREVCPGKEGYRAVDRSLQRLRRQGKLIYKAKKGWCCHGEG